MQVKAAILLGAIAAHARPELAGQTLISAFVLPAQRAVMPSHLCAQQARATPLRGACLRGVQKMGKRVFCGEDNLRRPYVRGAARTFVSSSIRMVKPEGAEGGKKKKTKKRRVDELLVERGLADDAKHAAALVMTGAVIADGSVRIDSAGAKVAEDTPFRLKGQKVHPWVSRGGMKLEHAIKEFKVDVSGAVAIDVGCSTGGFTHVLLHNGVDKVYAVDVGYGQLALQLRKDPRVVVMERTNARHLNRTSVPTPPDIVVCDASFIPLHKVLAASLALCQEPAVLLALIKPQFEAERHEVEAGTGVVRDAAVHDRVCKQVASWLQAQGWSVRGLTKSPITGPNGNVEFIIWAQLDRSVDHQDRA